jgi:hypothetical protein
LPYSEATTSTKIEVTGVAPPWWEQYWPYLALAGGLAAVGLIAGVVLTQRRE